MTSLTDYQNKFKTIVFRREDGILEMRFHTDGGPLRWGFLPHEEAEEAFLHIGCDRENKVVIMTGTGAEFSGPAPDPTANRKAHHMGPKEWAELARIVLQQPEMNRRYARLLMTEQLRRQMNELLPLGLALEGLAITQ